MFFSSKSETLQSLMGLVESSVIPYFFVIGVDQYKTKKDESIKKIFELFAGKSIIVRSCSRDEDNENFSGAGSFLSKVLLKNFRIDELKECIVQVVQSMNECNDSRIMIQEYIDNAVMSGVVMTKDINNYAPYYCINYYDNTSRTDIVTSGQDGSKVVYVFRGYPQDSIISKRISALLAMSSELEMITGEDSLDIEFVMDSDAKLYLLQLRRVYTPKNKHGNLFDSLSLFLDSTLDRLNSISGPHPELAGRKAVFGMMPDWNPAEIIGIAPRPLSVSIYKFLITDSTWSLARQKMGYKNILDSALMIVLGNNPFIDIRKSFNSFLPYGLNAGVSEKIVNCWINKIEENRHFHDSIEYNVATTCFDFSFDEENVDIFECLTYGEYIAYKEKLKELTVNNIRYALDSNFAEQHKSIDTLLQYLDHIKSKPQLLLIDLIQVLQNCRDLGALTFAVAARHAFIADKLLRSMISRNLLDSQRVEQFRLSLKGVTSEMIDAFNYVIDNHASESDFLDTYGHLRPSTYDICSPTYNEREGLFSKSDITPPTRSPNIEVFTLSSCEEDAIQSALSKTFDSKFSSSEIFSYISSSILLRESTKFHFTKVLSFFLSSIDRFGNNLGLTTEEISYLDLSAIFELNNIDISNDICQALKTASHRSKSIYEFNTLLKFPHIITDPKHIYVGTNGTSLPSFYGDQVVCGELLYLDEFFDNDIKLSDKVILIENADPGFDWIFTRKITGLITCFGGPNSHMSVRCAELGLAAAIGCGPTLFYELKEASMVELNCITQSVKIL